MERNLVFFGVGGPMGWVDFTPKLALPKELPIWSVYPTAILYFVFKRTNEIDDIEWKMQNLVFSF